MKIKRKFVLLWTILAALVYRCHSANNFKPHFTTSSGVITIKEDVKVGSVVFVLSASDNENDPMYFSLDSTGQSLFNVGSLNADQKSVNLTLKTKLNRELTSNYEFKAFVSDKQNDETRRGEKTFFVTVIDVNDNKPVFITQPYRVSVPENTTLNSLLLTVSATDADEAANAAVQYRFSNDSRSDIKLITLWKTDKFTIHNLNGKITLTGALDYETASSYVLTVVAEDTGVPQQSTEATVVIDVVDISDMPPVFDKLVYIERITENTPKGTSLVKVAARDGDRGVNNAIRYEITQGNTDGSFTINPTTGLITVNGSLDAEKTRSFTIFVQAFEVPDPSSNTTAQVLVEVIDQNDNPPVLNKHTYQFEIPENQAVPGRTITNEITVTDKDILLEHRSYQFELVGADSSKFSIDRSSGVLKFNSTLDYESKSNFTFTIVATETSTVEKFSDNATVDVYLINVNDNEPKFQQNSYNFTFNEEILPGSSIAVIKATDGDLGTFGVVNYELKGDAAEYFTVDSSTGNITAAKKLDYENKKSYQFRLFGRDGGGGFDYKEASTSINLLLVDINDNSPVFSKNSYSASISENLPAGTPLLDVTATDKDSGEFGRISYSISDGNNGSAFEINGTGHISTTISLDRETISSYQLTVLASDHGSPNRSTSVMVTVTVLDENDNSPVILPGQDIYRNISEDAGGGTELLSSIAVIDKDEGKNKKLLYRISSGNNFKRFNINPETGRITISPSGLDREDKPKYDLVINVTDNGNPPRYNTTTVYVTIIDVNDNVPQFVPSPTEDPNSYIITIPEGPGTLNSTIINLNATDKDDGINAMIRYTITDGNGQNFFDLDPSTGVLIAGKELDRENNQMPKDTSGRGRLVLTVEATDQAEPPNLRKSASTRVTVYVVDVNDNIPKFGKNIYEVRTSEATLSGSNILQVTAADDDWDNNGRVSYNITAGDTQGTFEITPNGNIAIKKTLDAEKAALFNLTITASDHGNPPLTATAFAVINVDDVNDNDPSFNQSTYTADVRENVQVGTPVVYVYATDDDKGPNGEITYSITNGNKNSAFAINNVTGQITTNSLINREKNSFYSLTVQAEDQGRPSSRKDFTTVEVTIVDENDNDPSFSAVSYVGEIFENSPAGTPLEMKIPIQATDKDTGNNALMTFSLAGLGSENFVINATTAVITTRNGSSLDREKNASYSLQVTVVDGGGRNSTVGLTVTVKDVNDMSPRFSSSKFYANVSESAKRGTVVRRVTATDDDEGINAQIVYSSNGADAKFYINRDTGDIIVDSNLDREFKSEYVLNITAGNFIGNVPDAYTQVFITVEDVIDDRPYFNTSSITAQLLENATIDTLVTKVEALDKDVGDTLSYAIVKGDLFGQFRIDNVTGEIRTSNALDRENITQYTLTIEATDSIGLKATVPFILTILDVNDNDPVFMEKSLFVEYREESPKGTRVTTVKATDSDEGVNANIRYDIVENITDYLSIDPVSGLITQGDKPLDREQDPFFNFTVKATDQGVPSRSAVAQVSINLLDANDNNPTFSNSTFYASVRENQPPGTPVIVITATDKDSGSNAKLIYGLIDQKSRFSEDFKIDESTGNVTTGEKLNRERINEYTLTIQALDGAFRPRRGSTTLIVTVLDDNDHAPVFTEATYTAKVSENVGIGSTVTKVSATDKDIDENARITYSLLSGNQNKAFKIDNTSGVITAASKLDRETNDSYTIVIKAEDQGNPAKSSNATVKITIEDYNDNVPKFRQSNYSATLRENARKDTTVVTVSATDADIGRNGLIKYKIESGDDNSIFAINEQSGVLSLKGKLDFEVTKVFKLNISAKDSGDIPLTGFTLVTVNVQDVDDNAPVFTQNEYKVSVLENITQWRLVAQLNATDSDSAQAQSNILYRIESGNDGNMFGIGQLNGTVYLLCGDGKCLDREKKQDYSLTVAAVSMVNATEQKGTAKLQIQILDVNDMVPVFLNLPYDTTILEDIGEENSGVNDDILTLAAKDGDIGLNAEIVFDIVSGNNEGYFTLNNVTGKLRKLKSLDREKNALFNLVVQATDKGVPPLSSTTNVTLRIKDQNDNYPNFTSVGMEVYRVFENITVNTQIAQFSATDKDEGNNAVIQYVIISGNTGGAFVLDNKNGSLKTAKVLDHEDIPVYDLIIQARDSGNPALTAQKEVKIIVIDLNDNSPKFASNDATLSVSENVGPGAVVGTVFARDFDATDKVYYYFVGGTKELFALDENTGIITTKKTLDREERATYIFEIKASNYRLDPQTLEPRARRRRSVSNSTSGTSSILRITITIGDKNDNGPKFKNTLYTGGVSDSIKHGAKALLVTATDADSGNNSRIAYSIDNSKFSVEKDTGWILAASSFAGETGKEYTFTITAKDNFGVEPYFNDTTTVTIYILVDKQRAVLISGRQPEEVRLNKDEFKRILENITGYIINIDDINYYQNENGEYDKSRTGILFHAVDPKTNKIVNRDTLIRSIDENYGKERKFFEEWKIKGVKEYVRTKEESTFDLKMALAIGFGVLLVFLICIFCFVLVVLRKRQKRRLRAAQAQSYGGSSHVSRRSSMSTLPNTNLHNHEGSNPIWVDPYHNWGMDDDDDPGADFRTFKTNGSVSNGGIRNGYKEKLNTSNPLFESRETYLNLDFDNNETADVDLSTFGRSTLSGRGSGNGSSNRTPSPEPYESSPPSDRNFYDNVEDKYKVTSI